MPDSSAALENVDQQLPEAQVNEGANTGQESPPAQTEGVNEPSMLDVVQAALSPTKEDAPASEEPDPKAEKVPGSEKAEDDLGELTAEELAKYGPRAQKRIRQLVDQTKELRAFRETAEPKIQSFDKMMGFVQQKGLTTQDVDFTFAMMAAVKEAPEVAYKALVPIVTELQKRIGLQLPEDLQRDVDVGLITPERARELSMARAQANQATTRLTETTQRQQRETQQAQHQRFVGDVTSTVANWDNQQARTDPDWSLKSARMSEKIELAIIRNPQRVRTPQDAIALCEEVKREVETELRQFRPKPRAVTPVVRGGSSSPRAAAAPTSMLDVVKGALGAG